MKLFINYLNWFNYQLFNLVSLINFLYFSINSFINHIDLKPDFKLENTFDLSIDLTFCYKSHD